jgi:type IV pilus assembly protein PilQ
MTRVRMVVFGIAALAFVGPSRVFGPATPSAQARPMSTTFFSTQAAGQERQYGGQPIDVDYQGADLREVLRQLATIGGINMVIDPSVPGNGHVDLTLKQVPWDQVLDVVIKTNQLKWESVGNVVRIVTSDLAQKELESLQKEQAARVDGAARASLKAESFQLNYAKGSDVEKFINAPGTLPPDLGKYTRALWDERSNTIIVTALPEAIEFLRPLIRDLDKPEAQVEIEARIVQTTRESARALGIQWGGSAQATPALGNTTKLGFPNSIAVGGAAQDGAGKPASVGNSGAIVNLPASSGTNTPSTGVGLSLGAVNGAFNIDVALTALQHKGNTKILSAPKVTTQNNVTAEVTQGTTVPFQAESNNTVTVQFKDAALKLNVTPHITGANTVILDVQLENGQPDFGHTVAGNPSIITQKASTRVMVADGVTTVIGGVMINQESINSDRTPGLGNLPLLGWLFKRSDTSSTDQEILIFITPRIIRGVS